MIRALLTTAILIIAVFAYGGQKLDQQVSGVDGADINLDEIIEDQVIIALNEYIKPWEETLISGTPTPSGGERGVVEPREAELRRLLGKRINISELITQLNRVGEIVKKLSVCDQRTRINSGDCAVRSEDQWSIKKGFEEIEKTIAESRSEDERREEKRTLSSHAF